GAVEVIEGVAHLQEIVASARGQRPQRRGGLEQEERLTEAQTAHRGPAAPVAIDGREGRRAERTGGEPPLPERHGQPAARVRDQTGCLDVVLQRRLAQESERRFAHDAPPVAWADRNRSWAACSPKTRRAAAQSWVASSRGQSSSSSQQLAEGLAP